MAYCDAHLFQSAQAAFGTFFTAIERVPEDDLLPRWRWGWHLRLRVEWAFVLKAAVHIHVHIHNGRVFFAIHTFCMWSQINVILVLHIV